VRAFVALELPADVRAGVTRAQAALRAAAESADVRWTEPAGFHVTLKFLGAVDDARVPTITDALAGAAATLAPFACATAALGAFPTPHRPRVVWIGVSGDDVARLATAVDAALAPLGSVAEARPFHAHVTLGRVRSPRGGARLGRGVADVDGGPPRRWVADAMVLFRSLTRPTGAVYEPVARLPLGPRS
jgi:2'-5' RNA ligase